METRKGGRRRDGSPERIIKSLPSILEAVSRYAVALWLIINVKQFMLIITLSLQRSHLHF